VAAASLFAVVCGAPASRVIIASGHSYLAGFMVPLTMAATTLVAARDVIKMAPRLAFGTALITGATSLMMRFIDPQVMCDRQLRCDETRDSLGQQWKICPVKVPAG